MTKKIPNHYNDPEFRRWLTDRKVRASLYEREIENANRLWGDQSLSIPGLFPHPTCEVFQTTSTAYTVINSYSAPVPLHLNRWNPTALYGRLLRQDYDDISARFVFRAAIKNLDLRIKIVDDEDYVAGTWTLSSSGLALATSIATPNSDDLSVGGDTDNGPRLMRCYMEARTYNGIAGTGYLYAGPTGREQLLRDGDQAFLRRGY